MEEEIDQFTMPLARACQLFLNKVRNDPETIVKWEVMHVFNAFMYGCTGSQVDQVTAFTNSPSKEGLVQCVKSIQGKSFIVGRDMNEKYEDLVLAITDCVTVTLDMEEVDRKAEEVGASLQSIAPSLAELMTEVVDVMQNHQPPYPANHTPANQVLVNHHQNINFFGDVIENEVEEIEASEENMNVGNAA